MLLINKHYQCTHLQLNCRLKSTPKWLHLCVLLLPFIESVWRSKRLFMHLTTKEKASFVSIKQRWILVAEKTEEGSLRGSMVSIFKDFEKQYLFIRLFCFDKFYTPSDNEDVFISVILKWNLSYSKTELVYFFSFKENRYACIPRQ